MDKPFAPSSERNKEPILQVLRERFAGVRDVLEIGSGSGQHAVHFAAALPHLRWQCSELDENLAGLRMWIDEAALPNLPPPIVLQADGPWPDERFDAVFTANTLHIMGWPQVQRLMSALPLVLRPNGLFTVYGPFNYAGRYTGAGNERFDQWLRERDARSAIRDFEAVDALAKDAGMALLEDRAMPADNHCISWRRRA